MFSSPSTHLVREQRLEQQYDGVRPHALANGHPAGPISQFTAVEEEPLINLSGQQHPPEIEQPMPTPPPDLTVEREAAPEYSETTGHGLGLMDMHRHTPPPPSPPTLQAPITPALPEVIEPKPHDDLHTKYMEALDEIERLRALLAAAPAPAPPSPSSTTTELRRRHPLSEDGELESTFGGTEFTTATVLPEDGPIQVEGVPLQVVAIIALAVFITTYLFF